MDTTTAPSAGSRLPADERLLLLVHAACEDVLVVPAALVEVVTTTLDGSLEGTGVDVGPLALDVARAVVRHQNTGDASAYRPGAVL